jgi:hypothetical protein
MDKLRSSAFPIKLSFSSGGSGLLFFFDTFFWAEVGLLKFPVGCSDNKGLLSEFLAGFDPTLIPFYG